VAHHHLGWILYENGRFAESRAQQEKTIALYDRRYHEPMVQMFGHDFGVTSLGWISWPLWYLGYPDQALQRGREAIALAQSFDHPFSIMHAYTMTAMVHIMRGEMIQGGEFGERVMTIATDYGFSTYIAAATFIRGAGLIGRGQVSAGIDLWWKSLPLYEAGGVQLYHRGTLSIIAELYAHTGQFELGHEALAKAEAIEGDDGASARIENAKGLLLMGQGAAPEIVETSFLRAIAIARQQQARSLELKATMNLCLLWQAQGRREEALENLTTVYRWFTEGLDTTDLRAAAVLLAELA
jgi:tetratricopeptide (TPR) repeat protein